MMMEKDKTTVRQTFDGLQREQLMIYARELSEHVKKERDLQDALSEREQQLRKLAAATIAAQEKERQWIAYEVHDRIAQALVSVYQQLQILESGTRNSGFVREVVARASTLLKEAMSETRNIMNDLHPPVLDEFGVIPLVEEELHRFEEESGVHASLQADYEVRPPRDVEVVLYRIFHEALINVGRHARGARNVNVFIKHTGQSIRLEVRDDGSGFDVPAAIASKHVGGLMSMQHRAEIVGGTFEVRSRPGEGTSVAITISCDSGRAAVGAGSK